MIQRSTYPIIPYTAPGCTLQPDDRNNHTYWLRTAINLLMNRQKAALLKAGVNIDLFHNHDTLRGQNRNEYPQIQYQRQGDRFFVTGIGDGVSALEHLFADARSMVLIDDRLSVKIGKPSTETYQPQLLERPRTFTLTDWLPLSDGSDREFAALASLSEKAAYLERRLRNHLLNDFCRYLNLGIDPEAVQLTLTDCSGMARPPVPIEENKHTKRFQPFTVQFATNLTLPAHICLGNKKVYGFGLVEAVNVYP